MKKYNSFRDLLNEITINKLQNIVNSHGTTTWNKNKSFEKFKSQIQDRIKMPHVTEEYLFKILQKGIELKFNDCYAGTISEEDDTCLIYARSQFAVIFNRAGNFIRSIRKITELDKIMCKTKTKLFEIKYGSDNELTRFLEQFEIVDLDEKDQGYEFSEIVQGEELLMETKKLCKLCLEIQL